MAGRFAEALARADELLGLLAPTSLEYCDTLLVRGDVLLAQGEASVEEVADLYERVARIAEERQLRMVQLRAATRLARMPRGPVADASARDALAAVYGSFTEGFDVPDLVAARAVLDAR